MIVQKFTGCTHTLVAEGCHDLPAMLYEDNGWPMWETRWQPTKEELARLKAGHAIVLTVIGNGHPPVKLEVW